jgi:hypothetical protein
MADVNLVKGDLVTTMGEEMWVAVVDGLAVASIAGLRIVDALEGRLGYGLDSNERPVGPRIGRRRLG